MNIQILCVGSLKERYLRDASYEYEKRLQKYCTIRIEEVKELKSPDIKTIISGEGGSLLGKIRKDAFTIALDIAGTAYASEGFARMLADLSLYGKSQICFIIGGSHGLSDAVLEKADKRLSFSRMTFPHQLIRILLLEQIYRAFKINNNEIYHK